MRRGEEGKATVLADRAMEDRRYVYSAENLQGRDPGYAVLKNKKGARRRLGIGTVLFWMGSASVAGVLYVGNSIEVDRLAVEGGRLEKDRERIVHENEVLRSEVNRGSTLERIETRASELGLQPALIPPQWFSIDESKVKDLEERDER